MRDVIVVGGGPAGLMAAEVAAEAGLSVTVVDHMPTVGRKLLMAGRGGLNLTHSESRDRFIGRYGRASPRLAAAIDAFPPDALRAFAHDLGEETFVGTSGRVFPCSFKASPLLRAWLARLDRLGVTRRTRLRWIGFEEGQPLFRDAEGRAERLACRALVLALGGASWPRLGSDGAWTEILEREGVAVAPLRPTNCGFAVSWSEVFRARFEGQPLKRLAVRFADHVSIGEAMITADGLEGGAVYGLSAPLREAIEASGPIEIRIDLKPGMTVEELETALTGGRKGDSLANRLRKGAGLPPAAIGLMREAGGGGLPATPAELARLIKDVPVRVEAARPLERAISSAGGVLLDEMTTDYMLRRLPGVFVAGEMLDWEAPTGGFLLQACFATGRAAGAGVVRRLRVDTP
ncbi:MAG: TIGR03862 family flavoprotein [Siculibacillus sp.]